jgi:uncharacterized protein with HEPN domain
MLQAIDRIDRYTHDMSERAFLESDLPTLRRQIAEILGTLT